ncbi:MAG TPA: hypothetical protein VIB62_04775 [Actinomycetota bacterium]
MSRAALALLLLFVAGARDAAWADSWPGPTAFTVFSESGRYFVRFLPGESVGDTVGFAGSPRGPYATALLYELQRDRAYRLLHEIRLVHPVSPLNALVADDGHFVTLDNWHNVGFGKVVAIYAPTGALVRGYELTGLYRVEKLEKIPRSVSSRYWRCAPVHFVEREQKSVYVPEALGGHFVFTLATGAMRYEAGSRTTCVPPNQPFSWSTLGR